MKKDEILSKLGHRQRMRERILQHGTENLADYELLEVILYTAIPRRDTKPLAKTLIAKYSSFIGLIQTSTSSLQEEALTDKIIALLQLPKIAAETLRKEEHKQMPCVSNWHILKNYLIAHPLYQDKSRKTYILYLDTKNFLLCLEELPSNNLLLEDQRAIATRILELHATALIIVDKHIQFSSLTLAQKAIALKIALEPLSVKLHDCVILNDGSFSSLEKNGFLKCEQ